MLQARKMQLDRQYIMRQSLKICARLMRAAFAFLFRVYIVKGNLSGTPGYEHML
jgi:hypothetical protein